MAISFRSTQPSPGDSTNVLLAKLLQVFGGTPASDSSDNTLLSQILEIANSGGSGLPAGAKVYRALLTQSGTDAPTVIELQNSIGDINWVRLDVGSYEGQLAGAFTFQKTFALINPILGADVTDIASISLNTVDAITITTGQAPALADGVLNTTAVEIIVYP